MIVEDPLEEVSDIFNTATPEEVTVLENVEEVVEVVEDDPAEDGVAAVAEADFAGDTGDGITTWTELQAEINVETPSNYIKLTHDLTAGDSDTALTIPEGKDITLDLNGHVLNRGLIAKDGTATSNDHGSVIEVYGTLTIKDGDPSTVHNFTKLDSGLWVLDDNGTETVTGGVITGGTGTKYKTPYYGGGIYVADTGELIVEAGTVCGNQTQRGGGIALLSNGNFIMWGGNICGNVSDGSNGDGGGVNNFGTFTMKGGSIEFNTSNRTGGGIYNYSELVITGGVISNNTAKSSGGGIRGDSKNNSISCKSDTNSKISITNNIAGGIGGGINASTSIELGGNVDISENTNDALKQPDDLYLNAAGNKIEFTLAYIKVVEPIDGMHIGVARQMSWSGDSYVVGPITDANTNPTVAEKALSHFYATVDTQYVRYNSEGYLELAEKMAITISDSIVNGTVTASPRGGLKDETITLTVTPDTGYTLKADTLKATYNDGTSKTITPVKDATDGTKYTFTMPGYPVTVTAEFEKRDLTVTKADGGEAVEGTDYQWKKITDGGYVLTILENGLAVSGSTTAERIVVDADVTDLTLDGVSIDLSACDNVYAVEIKSGNSPLELKLAGENTLKTKDMPAIFGSKNLEITGNGSLNAQSKQAHGACVGISVDGSLTIDGATVSSEGGASGGNYSAGIDASGGLILLNGTVTAKAVEGVGGSYGVYGSVTVNGGTLTAQGQSQAVSKTLTVAQGYKVTASENYDGSSPSEYKAENLANYKYIKVSEGTPSTITIGDIIAKSKDFPRSKSGAWENENGKKSYALENAIKIGEFNFLLSTALTESGEDYVYVWDGDMSNFIFKMKEGSLQSIIVSGSTRSAASNGEYKLRKTDPKPVEKESEEREPLFTGTWNNPVKNGAWSQDARGIWHYASSETFKNTWAYIYNPYAHDGQHTSDWFWFDEKGNMLTGWQRIGGKWYYLHPNKDGVLGSCLIGPAVTPDGHTVDATGAWDGNGTEPVSEAAKAGTNPGAASAPYTGTWNAPVQNGVWSLDANGIWHYTTTQQFKNTWAYIYNPYAHDGQHTSDWFWFDEKGNMLTGWQRIGGKWYYLHPNKDGVLGSCLIGPTTTPDGYKVDETGARID